MSTAAQLHEALDDVAPGDRIDLAPGRYVGQFLARTSGTPDRRIVLCGGPDAVLLVGSVRAGTALQLRASYWDVVGFTITTAQSGLTVVGGSFNELSGLTVWNTGHEAVKLRSFSTQNRVLGNVIHTTGKSDRDFGEGIYVGSAVNNWCAFSSCRVDRSDGNHIEGNRIWSTAAEAIDVKEGTTGGRIVANEFDGDGSSALSWVDVKGNGWVVAGNRGTTSSTDGFRTAVAVAGWGKGNTFEGNVADTRADGYGIRVTKDNLVRCDNVAPTAGRGVSNVACTPNS